MHTRFLQTVTLAILAALLAAPLAAQEQTTPDDRTLLRAEGAPPNVLVILDSGGTMPLDPKLNDLVFPAAGDDDGRYATQMKAWYAAHGVDLASALGMTDSEADAYLQGGSKMVQAKSALRYLFNAYPGFNYGFTYYEKDGLKVSHYDFIYSPSEPLLDGTPAGWPIRMGSKYDPNVNNQSGAAVPRYPIRFGARGDVKYYFYQAPVSPATAPWLPGTNPGSDPANGTLRMVQCLSDAAGNCLADITPANRFSQHLYYYPAYSFWALPDSVKLGFTGSASWAAVAAANGKPFSTAQDKIAFRDWVTGQLQQIGSPTLYITEDVQVFRNDTHEWITDSSVADNPHITPAVYRQHFVVYDISEGVSEARKGELIGGSTYSTPYYQGNADCGQAAGFTDLDYVDNSLTNVPIVPIPQPQADGTITTSQIPEIKEYLDPQTKPVFYFPDRAFNGTVPGLNQFLPDGRDHWIPFTETVIAAGRRPIKDTLNEVERYFGNTVNQWADAQRNCRLNFVILITDGEETCSNNTAPCVAATDLVRATQPYPVRVYTVYFGNKDNVDTNVIFCVSNNTGARSAAAGNEQELRDAFDIIAADIEERTRGFSSPIVPSVEATTEQTAYISTFTPFQDRSVWRGHLRAYPIDPATGVIAGLEAGSLNTDLASWDVGDLLAARNESSRLMYYGQRESTGAIPWTRELFTYPSGTATADAAKRAFLGDNIFHPDSFYDLSATTWGDTAAEKDELSNVVSFIRGVQMVRDASDNITTFGRDPNFYGWCGPTGNLDPNDPANAYAPCDTASVVGVEKLGDTFHGTPQLGGPPRCYPCWLRDIHGYRNGDGTNPGFFEVHQHRRQVLYVAANDGTMHAFEAGLWDPDGGTITSVDANGNTTTRDVGPSFDTGSGRELFAWLPQATMQTLDELTNGTEHWWTVDGPPTVADVWVDPAFTSAPVAANRTWRTLLLFGERRGGRSVVALDVTDPDGSTPPDGDVSATVKNSGINPASSSRDPQCVTGTSATGCTADWPSLRFEFKDEVMVTETVTNPDGTTTDVTHPVPADEDGNGYPDLGNTWSRPLVAFVTVQDAAGNDDDRSVAIFGGGFTRDGFTSDENHLSGNYLYVLDLETGKVLYKYQTAGMVPGDVTGIDLDLNGHLETIYWGDTAGDLYRMDMTEPATVSTTTGRVTNWTPYVFFHAGSAQPFFLRPAVAPIASGATTSQVVITLGTGDRDNIFTHNATPNRFYAIVDPGNITSPLTEADIYGPIYPTAAQTTPVDQNLLSAYGGWYLVLDDGSTTPLYEKVNTPAVIINQQVIFSTFSPGTTQTVTVGTGTDATTLCKRSGNARTYTVNLYNANPPVGSDRFIQQGEQTAMATEPVIYVGADGKIHVIQALDNLLLEEPVQAMDVPVRVMSWKER